MDILGDVCDPNSTPEELITINQLLDGLKKGDVINALTAKLSAASGISGLQNEISNLRTELNQFNVNFKITLNTKVLKTAVINQINNLVYNLLTGCGTNFLDLTLKQTVKDKLAPYVALLEAQQQLNAYTDPVTGNVIYTG